MLCLAHDIAIENVATHRRAWSLCTFKTLHSEMIFMMRNIFLVQKYDIVRDDQYDDKVWLIASAYEVVPPVIFQSQAIIASGVAFKRKPATVEVSLQWIQCCMLAGDVFCCIHIMSNCSSFVLEVGRPSSGFGHCDWMRSLSLQWTLFSSKCGYQQPTQRGWCSSSVWHIACSLKSGSAYINRVSVRIQASSLSHILMKTAAFLQIGK